METGVTDLSVKNPQIVEILDVREVKKSIFEVEFAHVFPFSSKETNIRFWSVYVLCVCLI